MKSFHRIRPSRRRFPHRAARQGVIHASQALPAVLAALYHSLAAQDPDFAANFRRDPLGLKHGMDFLQ